MSPDDGLKDGPLSVLQPFKRNAVRLDVKPIIPRLNFYLVIIRAPSVPLQINYLTLINN